MLNPNLSEPLLVLHKLEREMHRAFHHQNYTHKSDHFYNFCVTALSLKDYVLIYLCKKSQADKQPYWDEWASVDCLLAATEIANTAKHCVLERAPKTKAVEKSKSKVVNVYINDSGGIKDIEVVTPDYKVTLHNGNDLHIYEFTREIIDYWKQYLAIIGIEYIAQEKSIFFGDAKT